MSLRMLCGPPTFHATDALCLHHVVSFGQGWATSNRIMCDFLHRGIVVARAHGASVLSGTPPPPRRTVGE